MKVPVEDTIGHYVYLSYWRRDYNFTCMVIQATRGSSRLSKAMSIGPAPGIEPTPSHSEGKRFTDWAYPHTK